MRQNTELLNVTADGNLPLTLGVKQVANRQ